MAEAFFNLYNRNPEYQAASAGTHPAKSIKQLAIGVMQEKGVDISRRRLEMLTREMAEDAHRIYTMGCIQDCPLPPPQKTEDGNLADPAAKSIMVYRKVRDDIERRVKSLVSALG